MYGVGRFVHSFLYPKWSQIGADSKNVQKGRKLSFLVSRRVTGYLHPNLIRYLKNFKLRLKSGSLSMSEVFFVYA